MDIPRVAETTNLGPTNYQSRVQAATTVGETVYAVTFRQEPPYLVAYDPSTRRVTETHEIPIEEDVDSPGSWTLTALDDRYLYTMLRDPTELLRFDRRTESFERLRTLPDSWCRAMDSRDGTVYFSTIREPCLYAYEHAADELSDLGRVHPTERYTHDLHVSEDAVYVGGGTSAHLTAVDRESGEHRDLLPPALEGESAIQSVTEAADGRLVIGTSPSMRLAVLDPDRPGEATVVRPDLDYSGGAITSLFVDGGTAYFTTTDPSYAIWAYELGTTEVTKAAAPIGHPTRDIFERDGELLGVGSGGYSAVWTLDPATGETTRTLLGEVGLPRGAGNVQSLQAIGRTVYAGGSRVTAIHDVDAGECDIVTSPGEPKVMRVVDGVMYQAVYGGAGIARYDPDVGEVETLAWIGDDQNRPRGMHYHEPTGYLLVGTRPDYGFHGGAVSAFDPETDELVSVDRNVVQDHSIQSVTSIGETVYLGTEITGGGGTDPIAESARIAAWDPVDREVQWEATPFEGTGSIKGLTACEGILYGQSWEEGFFGFDPEAREVVVRREIKAGGSQQAHDGVVFGVNADQLFAYDPGSRRLEVLLDGLGGEEAWHNYPQLAIDGSDAVYVAQGKDLLQVELEGRE
jgi:hypothetical protein